jgi:hypothetical protein
MTGKGQRMLRRLPVRRERRVVIVSVIRLLLQPLVTDRGWRGPIWRAMVHVCRLLECMGPPVKRRERLLLLLLLLLLRLVSIRHGPGLCWRTTLHVRLGRCRP